MADSPGRLRGTRPGRPASRGVPVAAVVQVDVASDGLRSPVASARLAELMRAVLRAEQVTRATASLTLLSRRGMAAQNRRLLGHRGATDVISLGFDDGTGGLVADVYVCPDVAREHARGFGVGVREELCRLVVHGTLHACGWDHPAGEERLGSPMWRRQEQLVRRLVPRILAASSLSRS